MLRVTRSGPEKFKIITVPAEKGRMERPSLTLLLASVVSARMDGDPRGLLAHLHPRTPTQDPAAAAPGHTRLASVSALPRVIPMQRRNTEALTYTPEFDPQFDPDFDPTAA